MRELKYSVDALESTYMDYETNPDVIILDAYETIKDNYQRQVDATYLNNSFVSDLLTPLTDGVMKSGLGLVSNVALLANIFFIFGVLSSLGAVLTLPGIAGIILTSVGLLLLSFN